MPALSIIILNWNTRQLLGECLRSLMDTISGISYDLWVVDNASTDDSLAMLQEEFPSVNVIANSENLGFARANNQAMTQCSGEFMLLFNSDAVATPGSVQAMVELVQLQPKAGMVGAHLLNPDGNFQASYTPFPTLWQEFLILSGLGRTFSNPWYPSRGPDIETGPQVVDYVEGACMLVRRAAFEETGGMDEGYFMYAEEVDWCYALKQAGWQVWYHPGARIIHHGGASSRHRRTQREGDLYQSRVRFFRKNYGNWSAWMLKTMIFTLTALKNILHSLLRILTSNRRGRQVIPLNELREKLRGV